MNPLQLNEVTTNITYMLRADAEGCLGFQSEVAWMGLSIVESERNGRNRKQDFGDANDY